MAETLQVPAIDFPADHPTAAGHFPGRPIVPGAVLLERVLAAIAAAADCSACAWRVKSAKFPHAVVPGARVAIECEAAGGGWRFDCRVDGVRVLAGEAQMIAPTDAAAGKDAGR